MTVLNIAKKNCIERHRNQPLNIIIFMGADRIIEVNSEMTKKTVVIMVMIPKSFKEYLRSSFVQLDIYIVFYDGQKLVSRIDVG